MKCGRHHLWMEARVRLRTHQRDAAVFAAIWLILLLVLLLLGATFQRLCMGGWWQSRVGLALLCVGCRVLLTAPLATMSMWWLGETVGVLDESDCGFLGCSGKLWLWVRWGLLQLLSDTLLVVSVLPSAIVFCMAGMLWRSAIQVEESVFVLLLAAHVLLLSIVLLSLPLRVLAAQAVLPFCYLKSPHYAAPVLLLQGLAITRGHTVGLLMRRCLCLPLLLCPFTALSALPTLLTTELLFAQQHMQGAGGIYRAASHL